MVIFLLKNPQVTSEAAYGGVLICVKTVLPSVFPMLIVSGLAVESGFADWLGRIVGKPFGKLFGVPGACATTVILGAFSGFPVGAKCASQLYEKGMCTMDEAERLCAFCNYCGPSFIVGAVGGGLLGSASAGIAIWLCQTLVSWLYGIILARGKRHVLLGNYIPKKGRVNAAMITSVIKGASYSFFDICSFVIFFAVFVRMLSFVLAEFVNNDIVRALIFGLFEMTSGTAELLKLDLMPTLFLAPLIIGWSGISVHMQVSSFASVSGLSLKKYYLGKLICPPVTALLSFAICRLMSLV